LDMIGTPVFLNLTPPGATNDVATSHTVTAAVTDVGGQPVDEIVVRITVIGSINTSGQCTTDDGRCDFTYAGPLFPGADSITAFADTDRDGLHDVGEPVGEATKAWVLPTSTTGQASGAGHIEDADGNQIAFGFLARNENGRFVGHCNVIDHAVDRTIKCLDVTTLVISGNRAMIHGNATDNGTSTIYVITAVDNGNPGKDNDTFSISTTSGYSQQGTLTGGNVQVSP